jgi:hypothetical protein
MDEGGEEVHVGVGRNNRRALRRMNDMQRDSCGAMRFTYCALLDAMLR